MLKKAPPMIALLFAILPAAIGQSAIPSPVKKPMAWKTIAYINTRYGFPFRLPASWKGYSVLTKETWPGFPLSNDPHGQPAREEDQAKFEKGPKLCIRHPRWTETDPHEDIPIMVFTKAQWAMIGNEAMIVSAAPFGPSELERNANYVFALPARYNYDFSSGWEEVETIIDTRPLRAFSVTNHSPHQLPHRSNPIPLAPSP